MPNSRHTSVMLSPSSSRPTKRRRSSITELAFHGINTSRQKAKSVTHVSGTKCHLCLGPRTWCPYRTHGSPLSQEGHPLKEGACFTVEAKRMFPQDERNVFGIRFGF